ncbi:hypothetical protein D3C80_1335570 [compost metagenome]
MGTTHQIQHAVGTALHRQMQEAHQFRRIAIDIDDVIGKFNRMAGGETDAVDTIDSSHQTQQLGERASRTVVVFATPCVHVLTEQIHFTHALGG